MNLITGATGLLGSHIAEQLVKRGQKVRVLVRKSSDTSFLDSLGCEKAFGCLSDPASLKAACAGVQTVYHAAAKVGDWGQWEEFQTYTIDGTRNLLEAACQNSVKRFLHISTISVYGYVDGDVTVDETFPVGQNLYRWAYYSKAKVAAEQIVREYHASGRIQCTIIRPSWLYGERDRASIARMVKSIENNSVKLINGGNTRLSLSYAGNVAEGCILGATKDEAIGQTYNCCSDGDITQRQYFQMVAAAIGKKETNWKSVPYAVAKNVGLLLECIGRLTGRKDPPFVSRYAVWLMGRKAQFSCAKARKELGWVSSVDYATGIPRTVKWYLEHSR